MKNNKLLSFIVTCIFTLTAILACFPGISASATTITLSDDDYTHASSVLKMICPEFPLVDTAASSDAAPTTRAEFVAAVTMALNMPASTVESTGFGDVPAKHKYASNIAYAAGMGLINSVDLFYPDTPVTYAQAIKIIMSAAGYAKKAEYTGGFPTGYLRAANEAGVGKNLNLGNDDTLTHEVATSLIFEAVCTDILETTSFGSSYEYSTTAGKNILSVYHKIYIAEGVVEANENTGLYSLSSSSGKGFIQVNGKLFKCDGYQNLIGKNARIFFGSDSKNTVYYAYEKGNKLNEYTENDDISISGYTLSVSPLEGTKDIRYSLESDYTVIYNGKYYGAADYNDVIKPVAGTISLIDNDENSSIDVIVIKEFQYGVVSSVNEFEGKIYDKYKKNGLVDLSDSAVSYFVTEQDGTAIELYELEEDDAVAYAISKDKKLFEIVRLSDRVGGTYSARTSDGRIVVADKEFILSSYYTDNVKNINALKFGSEVILHLGQSGQVVYVQEFSTSLRYGFVVDTAKQTGLGGKAMVKLFGDDGKMAELVCADKVTLDGVSKTLQSDITSALEAIEAKPYAYRVVKYALNAEGELSKIFTATDNTTGTGVIYHQPIDESRPLIYYDSTKLTEGGVISDDPTVAVPYAIENSSCPYSIYGSFSPYFHKGSGAVTMKIPVRPVDFQDDDKFGISPSIEEEYVRTVAYDVTTGGAASFILVSMDSSGGSIGRYTASSIIESITQGVNEDGEVATVIKVFSGGSWDKFYYVAGTTKISSENSGGDGTTVLADGSINDFAPGDIIRMTTNADKVITEMTMNFDASTKTIPSTLTQSTSNGGRRVEFIGGYALGISGAKQGILATGMTPDDIAAVQGNVDISKTFSASFTRGTTVFVRFNRDRQSGDISNAVVYTETDLNSVETYFNSGSTMDYIVLRQYFREPSLNVIYVNIDE